MLTFSDADARRLLATGAVVAAIEAAFRRDYKATASMPTRLHMTVPPSGNLLLMPCHDHAMPAMGVKVVMVSDYPGTGADRVQATYLLFDPATGALRALIDANYLTDLRTAATSAVATRFMARQDQAAAVLGIFGTGRQARAHLEVFTNIDVFPRTGATKSPRFSDILVSGSSLQASQTFASKMSAQLGIPITAVDAKTCASESHVICTCTSATQPLFDGKLLQPGAHLNLVGAFRPNTREVDSETVRRARLVVDTYDGALSEAGDILIPLQEQVIARSHIIADLHEIVSGRRIARTSAEEITIFKSVGCALEDLVTATLLFDAAQK